MYITSFEILFLITIVVFTIVGGLIGWFYGYKAGFRGATREAQEFLKTSKPLYEFHCTLCGATIPDHFHGCPIAAEFKLVTIAKPGG